MTSVIFQGSDRPMKHSMTPKERRKEGFSNFPSRGSFQYGKGGFFKFSLALRLLMLKEGFSNFPSRFGADPWRGVTRGRTWLTGCSLRFGERCKRLFFFPLSYLREVYGFFPLLTELFGGVRGFIEFSSGTRRAIGGTSAPSADYCLHEWRTVSEV